MGNAQFFGGEEEKEPINSTIKENKMNNDNYYSSEEEETALDGGPGGPGEPKLSIDSEINILLFIAIGMSFYYVNRRRIQNN